MKRRDAALFVVLLLGLAVAASAAGRLVTETISIATAGLTEGTNTVSISGWLDTVIFDVPAGTVTGDVDIVYSPPESTVADVTIYSNDTVTADVILRPRIDASTMGTGAALTTDPPVPIALPKRSTITFAVTNGSATNLTWKLILIYEKPD